MPTVGSVLRAERLRKGLTIDAISIETKISVFRLQALEADDLSSFASPFFYRSFVKQVAARLGVDEKSINDVVDSQAASIRQPLLPGEGDREHPNVPALDNVGNRAQARWLIPVVSLVVVVVASSAVFALWDQASGAKRFANPPFSLPSAVVADSSAVKAPTLPPPSPPQPHAAEAAAPPAKPEQANEAADKAVAAPSLSPVEIELAALGKVWISVVSDGKFIFSGVLSPEQTKSFSSREVTRIRVGDAAALSIKYNGRQIGALGAAGSVCTAVFTANNYEIVGPKPQVELTHYVAGGDSR